MEDSFCGIKENTVLVCKRREQTTTTPQPTKQPQNVENNSTAVENSSSLQQPNQPESTTEDPKYASIAFLDKLRKMREEITNESKIATPPIFSATDNRRPSNIRSPSELSIHSVRTTAYDDSECNCNI